MTPCTWCSRCWASPPSWVSQHPAAPMRSSLEQPQINVPPHLPFPNLDCYQIVLGHKVLTSPASLAEEEVSSEGWVGAGHKAQGASCKVQDAECRTLTSFHTTLSGVCQARTDCYGNVNRIDTTGASCNTAKPEGLNYCGESYTSVGLLSSTEAQ